ncbi:MAG TPA: amino acid adenylation domain-containing protein [Pyrinomonadaceae bacterium]|nr:amino acid adenylation domain-containing protein [Pyrinomonadaceae bacterium]
MSANVIISESLAGFSPAKLALLEFKLKKKRRATVAQSIPRAADCDSAPLSYNQQGLWVLNRLMPGSSIYHTPTAARLTGTLDVAALKQALNFIVARHQTLRTTFSLVGGTPRQVITEHLSLEFPLIDLRDLPESERELEAGRRVKQEAMRPFDLARGPLIRAILLRLGAREHILLVTMHHIVTDGWSVGVFHQELTALYEAFLAGKLSPLAELPIQYADYAQWQRQRFGSDAYGSQLSYWKQQFETLPPVLELPTDHSRPNAQAYREFRGAQHEICLSEQLTSDLKLLCQKENVTLFMTLLTAYQLLLYRYSGEEDIVIGTPIAGRSLPETEGLIGLFINTLALRTSLTGNPTARELLRRVKETALGGFANQDLPFEQLVKELQPDRSLQHNPLFQAMFVLQSEELPPLQLTGLTVSHFRVGNTRANFDLTLDIVERDGQLVCLFEWNADLFEAETIVRMMGHFQNLLAGLVANPEQRISQLPLLSKGERRQLLVEWNDTKTDYPAHRCVQELFEQQVESAPDAMALICEDRRVNYRELNSQANQLAHYLKRRGVGPDTRVGICIGRSPEMIVALLGILKAGGAYVPLDPDYPQARLKFMLEDARVPVLLTQNALFQNLPPSAAEMICVDELSEEIARESQSNPEIATTADNLAYVMYTSGSTGKPKGVAVKHRNVVRLVKNTNYASFSPDEVFLQFAPVSFDAATFEIWGSLLNGARLALMLSAKASLQELGLALKRYRVTTLWLTAGLFNLMVDNHLDDLRGLRQLLAGGDVLSVPHVRKVFEELKDCCLINGYGPTENTTFTCCYPLKDLAKVNGSVPIGYPISNTSVYILDAWMSPSPIGVPGELYIGGDGLAHGYLDRPELNAERFIRDPFSTVPGARLYKTGDLARYRATGEIEFVGRIDNQVKVRGFRVELGEIEAALAEHPSVREAVVVARRDEGDKHLVAYLVPCEDRSIAIDEVRDFLKQRLPDHMVPSVFVVLESLPLSPTGKVDRLALPSTNGAKPTTVTSFSAPADELELKLKRIWERVLGIDSIGVNDNFFELGGHSLLAVRLFAQIEESFSRNLPLATLFQAPTVKQLARVLREEGWPAPWSSLVMIQGGDKRPPFFCVHAAGGNVLEYRDLARLLGPDQPFYGLQAKGLDGKQEPHTTIKEMAAHYIEEMRDVQPEGPYLIGGRSSGGTITFEMACQLAAEGQQVALLALLDTYPAGYFKLLPGSGTLRQRVTRYAKKLESHIDNLCQLGAREKVGYLLNKLRYAPEKIKHKLYRRAYKIYKRVGRPLPPVLKNIEEINFAAVKDYVPQAYSGSVTLFLASDLTADYDLHDGWRELVEGSIDTYEIPGNHINIIKEPHVGALAENLRSCLDKAQEDHSIVPQPA